MQSYSQLETKRFAALDIGTVTCRMLVADVDANGVITELDKEYRITNLGEGVDATGVLKPEAIARVKSAVSDYLRVLEGFRDEAHPSIELRIVSTSAARDAKNAADFHAALADLGVALTIIPGEKEAALSFAGAAAGFAGEDLFVVDIGGGSTEVIAGSTEQGGASIRRAHSFNIGCRRMTEKFLRSDPPTAEELEQARLWCAEDMAGYFAELRDAGFSPKRLVAVAGTATTVVAIREHMVEYDSSRVHLAEVSRADIVDVYDQLKSVDLEHRQAIEGLDPGRAPVITAGMVILLTVLELAGFESYTVSESDILHGIILDAAAGVAE